MSTAATPTAQPAAPPPASPLAARLANVPHAQPFNIDDFSDELDGNKQHYDTATHSAEDPQAIDSAPPPEGMEGMDGMQVRAATKRKSAKAFIATIDHFQSACFTWFAGNQDRSVFKMSQEDRLEMVGYMEEGMPDDWKMPWYIPLIFCMVFMLVSNWTTAQKLRKEKREREAAEAKERAKEVQRTNPGAPPPAPTAEQLREMHARKLAEKQAATTPKAPPQVPPVPPATAIPPAAPPTVAVPAVAAVVRPGVTVEVPEYTPVPRTDTNASVVKKKVQGNKKKGGK